MTSLAGALAAPLAAEAQQAGKLYRIGYLQSGSLTSAPHLLQAFRQGLNELGWVEHQNFSIEYRFAEGRHERLPGLAAELVRLNVDVIVAGPTPPALAAKNATSTIPIVMNAVGDPVEQGLVASLARPGGNVTGVSFSVDLEIFAKGLELLRNSAPKIRVVAVLSNPANPSQALGVRHVTAAARSLGLQLRVSPVRGPDEFVGTFAAMAKDRVQAP